MTVHPSRPLPPLTPLHHLPPPSPHLPSHISPSPTHLLPLNRNPRDPPLHRLAWLREIQRVLRDRTSRCAEDIGDGTEVGAVFVAEEGYGATGSAGTTCSADSVDVALNRLWEV